jgi:polygalacturonase
MATMVSLSLLTAAHIILVAVPRSASAADMIEPPKVDELAIPRQQRFDLSKFGGKGDGVTLNTDAFTAAVAAIKAAGGGELYVGKGVWMTTGFALTSHMSLFLEDGATLLGASPNNSRWRPRNESCSSYPKVYPAACRGGPSHTEDRGTGVDERNSGYEPIIGGWNLTDVLITGNNGTIAGRRTPGGVGTGNTAAPTRCSSLAAAASSSRTSLSKTAPSGPCASGPRSRCGRAT